MNRRVVKLGGSLLARADLPHRFAQWRAAQPPALDLVIPGGGRLADGVREYAARFALHDESAHQRCLECLSVNARIVAELLSAPLAIALDELCEPPTPGPVVFDPQPFLADVEPTLANPLPHDWTVTSDSIAARVAEFWDAELVLLKSAPCAAHNWTAAAAAGYVDEHFPIIAARLPAVSAIALV